MAAIGTDTGGSIRVPAALGGLAGYRASLGRGDWRGGAHLAQSFDTMGWLFRDLEDAPLLAGLFAPEPAAEPKEVRRFAVVEDSFFHDCEPEIVGSLHATARVLEALGLERAHGWMRVGGQSPLRFMRRSRRGRRHASMRATSTGLSLRSASGWSGARALATQRLPRCASGTRSSAPAWMSCWPTHELILLPAAPVARLAAAHGSQQDTRPAAALHHAVQPGRRPRGRHSMRRWRRANGRRVSQPRRRSDAAAAQLGAARNMAGSLSHA